MATSTQPKASKRKKRGKGATQPGAGLVKAEAKRQSTQPGGVPKAFRPKKKGKFATQPR